MGHRSWLTFVETPDQAQVLASNLEGISEQQPSVYGVDFILKLHTPRHGKNFVVAWSGDGSMTRYAAQGYYDSTVLLDEIEDSDAWCENPYRFGEKVNPKSAIEPNEEQRIQLERAALEISRRYSNAGERMPYLIQRDGERFAAGYLEGLGQAADLLRPYIDWRK